MTLVCLALCPQHSLEYHYNKNLLQKNYSSNSDTFAGPKRGRPTPGFSIVLHLFVCTLVCLSPQSKNNSTHFLSLRFPKFQFDMQYLDTKKIMQPLGTKKITKSLRTKNETFWDKKKSCNLSGQKKSRNFSGPKESRILSGQKKSCNLLGQKKPCNLLGDKNHALNRSNCVQISPQGSKLLKMAPNLSKFVQMGPNRLE